MIFIHKWKPTHLIMIYSSIKLCGTTNINCVIKSCQMTAKSNLEEKHFSSKERIKSITRFGLSECVMISGMVIYRTHILIPLWPIWFIYIWNMNHIYQLSDLISVCWLWMNKSLDVFDSGVPIHHKGQNKSYKAWYNRADQILT